MFISNKIIISVFVHSVKFLAFGNSIKETRLVAESWKFCRWGRTIHTGHVRNVGVARGCDWKQKKETGIFWGRIFTW